MYDRKVEGQSLEQWDGVLTSHLLENNCEFVIGDLINEMALELNHDVITGKNWAESVALSAKEAEAVTLHNDGVVESCLNGSLCRHDGEVLHVFETLVSDFNSKSEGLCLRIDVGGADLFELDLWLELLDSLLDVRVVLVHHINDELGGVQAESISRGVVSAELWRDSWDSSRGYDPIGSFTWARVAQEIMSSANLELVGWVSL